MSKHYTREDVLADMRDIGNDWTEKVIDLKAGETAWSPLSDKWVFGGPGKVTYKNHPSGMDVIHEGTRKTYK
ncbi:hypothetical protein [Nocardia brasiliensis]|uniref:hypothetical protein n=1 Tax=Nocardia brasiliensis TaxID=37326 RepID=UPI0024541068|nr:hypothetical protein [Nocardia brasiliensis]